MFRRKARFFKVVRNEAEDQYAVWPANAEEGDGWQNTGQIGHEEDCEQFIAHNEKKRAVSFWRR
jgi:uncharacterized protein YbdZ (MbtH family)